MPKVSVIIPIYQAEQYIERCCHSLFNQTLSDMEFIFVNDGSKDNSIQIIKNILERFPNRKSQTKIINRKENRGVAYSRQEGMNNASGEYVIHCDSDDWIEPIMYKKLLETALKENADVVCCGYQINGESGILSNINYNSLDYFTPLNFNISPLTGSLWNKLIRRQLIITNDIKFPDDIGWGEDFCIAISCLLISSKTVCLHEGYYHYWQNESSITHNISFKKTMELVHVAKYVERFLIKINKINQFHFQLDYLKFQTKAPFLIIKEIRNISQWKMIYPECHNNIMEYDSPLYLRLVAWFIVHKMTLLAKVALSLRDYHHTH